jgi:hypothetical protein
MRLLLDQLSPGGNPMIQWICRASEAISPRNYGRNFGKNRVCSPRAFARTGISPFGFLTSLVLSGTALAIFCGAFLLFDQNASLPPRSNTAIASVPSPGAYNRDFDVIRLARDDDVHPISSAMLLIRTGFIEWREYRIDLLTLGRIWVHVLQIIHQGKIFGTKFFLQFSDLLR